MIEMMLIFGDMYTLFALKSKFLSVNLENFKWVENGSWKSFNVGTLKQTLGLYIY